MRVSNKVAVDMYKQLGYSVYRRVLEYYSGDPDEDAFGNFIYLHCKIKYSVLLLFLCDRMAKP